MENIKLYIRLNEDNEITHAFTTVFEQPLESDVVYLEPSGGHVAASAPELTNLFDFKSGEYRFKYVDGKAVEKTAEEMFNITNYKNKISEQVSLRSRTAFRAILDEQTERNILYGATANYPTYLQGETGKQNVTKMIEQFKTIAKQAKIDIREATTKEAIDNILNALAFPTEAEILTEINEGS